MMAHIEDVFAEIDSSRFLAALLVDTQGHPVASFAPDGLDADTRHAPAEAAQRIIHDPNGIELLASFQESVFYDLDGRRLVCRVVMIDHQTYILIVLTPSDTAYRRALQSLVRDLEKTG